MEREKENKKVIIFHHKNIYRMLEGKSSNSIVTLVCSHRYEDINLLISVRCSSGLLLYVRSAFPPSHTYLSIKFNDSYFFSFSFSTPKNIAQEISSFFVCALSFRENSLGVFFFGKFISLSK